MKIYVDDKPLEVKEGQNLLHAALSHGYDLPYFCWHEALGSVGACRQCAVIQYKDADDKKGRLVMSCMTPALEGARISIEHPDAKTFRASVIEWLMTNHPHDCPVCDEGGECHLQDMTVMTGHNYRRYRFNKRTFKNQNLGPYINHEMNRCITCYRCVRFYRDLAGGTDLNAFSSSNRVYFGRAEEGQLESEFSGNLVEICPTGVFTDKTFKQNYVRKWDLQSAPSVCQMCSLGCNITPGERGGILRRVQNRFHSEINGYFLCDKGRFGHAFVNSPERLRQPLIRLSQASAQSAAPLHEVIAFTKDKLSAAKSRIGIGSSSTSLESNFALRKLVGPENFYSDENAEEYACVEHAYSVLKQRKIKTPSLKEIEEADAVLILGEDLTNTAPMMAFSVRQVVLHQAQKTAAKMQIPAWNDAAVRNLVREKTGPIYSFQTGKTKLDDVAAKAVVCDADRIAEIAMAISQSLNDGSPSLKIAESDRTLVNEIVAVMRAAQNPVVICGASLGSVALVEAATSLVLALKAHVKAAALSFVVPKSNSLGIHILGAKAPAALKERVDAGVDVAVVLESCHAVLDTASRVQPTTPNNVLPWTPGQARSDKGIRLEKVECIIALDYMNNLAVARADAVIPVASFAESTGSLVNNEGRVQRYFRVFAPQAEVRDAWHVLTELSATFSTINELTHEMATTIQDLRGWEEHVTNSNFRVCGQKIPRAPSEQSGRTAIYANKTMHEPAPPQDPDSPYAHSMEGASAHVPAAKAAFFWAPSWNSVQSLNKFQEDVGGPLKGGPTGYRLFDEKDNGITV
jgi:NADH-quinone oxidoreductase subunit G